MASFFHTFLYEPIYNLLVFFLNIVPGGDIGLAVIVVTITIRLLIMPLSLSAIRTQQAMKAIEPALKEVREKHKNDKEQQAKAMFELYRVHRVNPFASFATLIIQLPILIGLYWVFRTETLPTVDAALLYSFVPIPDAVSGLFLGFVALSAPSVVLAICAAATQFFQARISVPVPAPRTPGGAPSMQEEFGRAMALQMHFVLPPIIGAVAYTSGAIALYFITSALVSIAQELFVRHSGFRNPTSSKPVRP